MKIILKQARLGATVESFVLYEEITKSQNLNFQAFQLSTEGKEETLLNYYCAN